ncbi:MAG: deoxyribonuclease IV [Bacteroidetes bacterium]|jgi:deoxyribonuclease-4|nr:deoxyribonuclease IV [Bacteroidota bacterium]
MSIAGGLHTAVERALRAGCTALQLFVKNNNQWNGKPLTDEDVATYKAAVSDANLGPVVVHTSYLINLAAVDPDTLKRSRAALQDELERCERLDIPLINLHPGAHMGAGVEAGIERIAESLNIVHDRTSACRTKTVLETTAGQGSSIGHRFEELRAIIDRVQAPARMAVCLDTCHVFAAGYDISTEAGYEETLQAFDEIVGLDRLAAFHVNDSKKMLGSRVDRHEHIGKGVMGLVPFRCLMNDPRFIDTPKVLETPKGEDLHEDIENLAVLRGLIASRGGHQPQRAQRSQRPR